MKDIIMQKLDKMEDLTQKKILKNIMMSIFSNVVDYQEEMNQKLEKKVFEEVVCSNEIYDVNICVEKRSRIDSLDEFMNPVFSSDIEETKLNCKDIMQKINLQEKVVLSTIFMKCSYKKIKEIKANKKIFKGNIVTDKGSYEIGIRLEQNKKYLQQVEKLYKCFMKNNIPWKTVNSAYFSKFFDVILVNCDKISEDQEIQTIKFDLEEYEEYKEIDIIPIWNINKTSITGSSFPVAAIDKINYEHTVYFKKSIRNNGYIVCDDDRYIKYIKGIENGIVIVCPKDSILVWNILEITQPQNDEELNYEYKVVSNRKNNSFLESYRNVHMPVIRTKAEISRIANSFIASKDFEFVDAKVNENAASFADTYDMNNFIADDIRMENQKKIMNLKFKTKCKDELLLNDILSFLISEIQMYFPEYECRGELV